ncbi:MAG: response regulator with CheY-like receiver domain and winged-helix DNA-binding domain [Actinotalea sp.]|nr:response regulator with CheY-like receiver domain and winged-helix DNA-binding domain [Actinotalea sp.]
MNDTGTAALVVVVEDEPAIADAVAARLRADGHRVLVAADGPSGVALCREQRPDLVVLDLMLPGLDGYEVCRQVQADRPVPVLMLSARDEETDVVVGLRVGADDYVTKPFSPRELSARVAALLRRSARSAAPLPRLQVGAVTLDPAARLVTVAGEPVHLTPTEFDLLARLAERPGTVLSREQLLADVWGWRGDASTTRTVDTHVASLRRKVGDGVVRTVHGVGYAAATP